MADLLENLNERQREAVLETEGYVRVIAGAGSGKTKLLVSRYAYLVQEYGIDSGNILCVTFTNKAAGEMKRRIRSLIGDGNDMGLICTYHGFCNRLLRENPEKLFLNKQFQIIDSHQQKNILDEIYQKYELKLDYATFEAMLRKIGRAKKQDMGYVRRMCTPGPCSILGEIKDQDDRIMEDFLQRQKATYSLDFNDLIAFAIYLLETDPEIREKWQDRLNYIMVDEFQDSSAVEMRLVEILSGMYQNLMIVGDPDQNIYEWRGSDVKLLVDFDKAHEPTKTIILNQNYRSTPQILKCANTLIEKNELRLKKDLFTRNPAGAPVVHYHSKDEFQEMDQVIDNIKRLREKEGFRYSDFAIIYRASFLSRVTEKKLVEKNIPYEIFGGVRFYQRMEILDILAYLRLIAYGDDASFLRIVNTPRRRFGRGKLNYLEELREREAAEGLPYRSLYATLAEHLDEREFANSDVGGFVRFMEEMRGSYKTRRISDIVNKVTEMSGYESYIRGLGDEERLDNLAEFKRIANEFEHDFGEFLSLEEFLQQVALQSGEGREESKDAVKLMTIHSSKGLEFPAVFILGFTEGVFPSAKTIGDRKKLGLEEERRLCYVAITRAEKYLFLMESEGTSDSGAKKLVSRFLEEIGEKNYVRVGRISEALWQESRKYTAKLNCEMQLEAAGSRKVGDIVEHHVFGSGIIEAIDEKRGSYSVRFEKLKQPRNISSSYFTKEHQEIRPEAEEKETQPKEQPPNAQPPEEQPPEEQPPEELPLEEQPPEEQPPEEQPPEEQPPNAQPPMVRKAACDGQKKGVETAETRSDGQKSDVETAETSSAGHKKGIETGNTRSSGQKKGIEAGELGNAGQQEEVSPLEIEIIDQDELDKYEEEYGTLEDAASDSRLLSLDRLLSGAPYLKALRQDGSSRKEDGEGEAEANAMTEEKDEAEPEANTMTEKEAEPEANTMTEEKAEAEPYATTETDAKAGTEAARLQALKDNSPNLWKQSSVPHSGWTCVGVEDLGSPSGICEMCGYQIIRYAHQMEHPGYRSLSVGCVCAGRMEGDVAQAKRREADFKNRQTRRVNFFKRTWKKSRKGNEYLKVGDHVAVLYHDTRGKGSWKYSMDNEFCRTAYATRERAVAGVFEALERLTRGTL